MLPALKEGFAVKNIRIWYEKTGISKYISHLDMVRLMERAIKRAKLPFWYTEGFNPHIFLTINMPISLGYTSLKECMDVKVLDDDYDFNAIIEKLNSGMPQGINVYAVTLPKMKPGEMAFSSYEVELDYQDDVIDKMKDFLSKKEIIVRKKTKKSFKDIDIKPYFEKMEIEKNGEYVKIKLTLPSSNQGSINPNLFFKALMEEYEFKIYPSVKRVNCFNAEMTEFA